MSQSELIRSYYLRGQSDDIIGHPDGKRNPSASSEPIESTPTT